MKERVTDLWTEETRWIWGEAQRIAEMYDRSYSLVLYRGLQTYREGGDPEQIRKAMYDYCWGKTGVAKSHKSGVCGNGTG